MDSLKSFIERYTALSPSDWQKIAPLFVRQEICAEAWLLPEGKICRHLYFLESGLLRFAFLKDGNEVTKFFTESPYVFTSQQSFSQQRPALEGIQAIEDSVVWRMQRDDAYRLLDLRSWSEFVRQLVQEVQFFTEEILIDLQTETAENRYRTMLMQSPELLQRVPLKYLASYLGIAQPSLSRIRKNITPNTNLT